MTATISGVITKASPEELSSGTEATPGTPPSEYIPAEETQAETKDLYLDLEPLHQLADKQRITVPRSPTFSRKEVVNAFQSAFDLIGGVPRLALWAHDHEAEFYKLYGKLLPSGASTALGEANELVILHKLDRSPLDESA